MNKHREMVEVVRAIRALADVYDREDSPVDQFTHVRQVATFLRAQGADDDLVVFGLVHDVGKVWHEEHHGKVAAALMHGRLRPSLVELLDTHSELVGRHRAPQTAEEQLFIDAYAMDPHTYEPDPLETFLPELERVMSR